MEDRPTTPIRPAPARPQAIGSNETTHTTDTRDRTAATQARATGARERPPSGAAPPERPRSSDPRAAAQLAPPSPRILATTGQGRISRTREPRRAQVDLNATLRACGLKPRELARRLKLRRPLAFLRVTAVPTAQRFRIGRIAALRLERRGDTFLFCEPVDPGPPIIPEAPGAHGGRGDCPAASPELAAVAPRLKTFLGGCAVADLDRTGLSITLLEVGCFLADIEFPITRELLVDARGIHDHERLALEAVLRSSCGPARAGEASLAAAA